METIVLPVMKAVDFMAEAKEVIKLATSLAAVDHISLDDPLGQELLTITEKELTIVIECMKDLPADCILNSALRTRIEYVLFMIHHCQRKLDKGLISSLASICLVQLFDLLKLLEQRIERTDDNDSVLSAAHTNATHLRTPTANHNTPAGTTSTFQDSASDENHTNEAELHKYRLEQNMGESRTQWVEMCFSSTATAVVALLRQVPSSHTLLTSLKLTDYIALCYSLHWQLQVVGLRLVHCELWCEHIGNSSNDTSSDGSNTNANNSADTGNSSTVNIGIAGRGKSKLSKSQSAAGIEARTSGKITTTTTSSNNSTNNTNTSSGASGSKSVKERSVGGTRVSTSAGSSTSTIVDGSLSTRSTSPSTTATTTTNDDTTTNTTTMRTTRSGSTGVAQLRRAVSSMQQQQQQGSARTLVQVPRGIVEVWRGGYMRTILALLLHSREIVRKGAAEVVQLALDISFPSTNTTAPTTSTIPAISISDICACCVEHGLVPQLEYVQQGVYVYRNTMHNSAGGGSSGSSGTGSSTTNILYFPELHIRTLATTLLHHIVHTVHTHPALLSRLTNSMLHSGNTKLRVNVLSGLLYIAGRCADIGRLLCAPVRPPTPTTSSSNSTNAITNTASTTGIASTNSRSAKSIVAPPITSTTVRGISVSAKISSTSTTTSNNNNITSATSGNSTNDTLAHTTPRLTLFHTLLTSFINNSINYDAIHSVLHILIHFMECALNMQHVVGTVSSGTRGGLGNEIGTQTHISTTNSTNTTNTNNTNNTNNSIRSATTNNNTAHPLLHHIEPMVLIQDTTTSATTSRTTRMVCPTLQVVQKHSAELAKVLQTAMERQIQYAVHSIQTTNPTTNTSTTTNTNITNTNTNTNTSINTTLSPRELQTQVLLVLKNLDDSHFAVLKGSYNIWQEIFSHMTDPFLLNTVDNITTLGVIECLYITTQYNMRELGLKYAQALVARMDKDNFLQIFQASTGIYFPTKPTTTRSYSSNINNTGGSGGASDIDPTPLTLHLYQALHCVKYLDSNLEKIMHVMKARDNAVVVNCVHRVLLCVCF